MCCASDRSLPRAPWRRSSKTNACAKPILEYSTWDRAAMIEVEHLEAGYGGVAVLREVSLYLAANETVAVIGANGAGKSTLGAALCGLSAARAGATVHRETAITRPPHHG